jgi:hypothetical protein
MGGRSYSHIEVYGELLYSVQAEDDTIEYLVSLMVNRRYSRKIFSLDGPYFSPHRMGQMLPKAKGKLVTHEAEMPDWASAVREPQCRHRPPAPA